MDQNVTELQKRRADNIIWTCAGDYSFSPDFKAYNSSGDADIYWNIIFGAARRHYEYEKLGLPRPDTVLFLEIPAEAALGRIRSRETETGVARDIHERDAAYLAACAEAAEEAADFFGWKRLRVAGPEGSLTPDEVARRVAAEVLSSRAVRDAHY